MKPLTCEICAGNDLIKQNGMFVCQNCGTKYSVDEVKKMMNVGTMEVVGTVKVDSSDKLNNLYQTARRAKFDNNSVNARKYYDMILAEDPTSWEAAFYVVYYTNIGAFYITNYTQIVKNCVDNVLGLVKDFVRNYNEQKKAFTEVANRVISLSEGLINLATNEYNEIPNDYKRLDQKYFVEYTNNIYAVIELVYYLGDRLDIIFGTDKDANTLSVTAWKQAITWHNSNVKQFSNKENHKNIIFFYINKVKKYDAFYTATVPVVKTSGCYIATAVYGSYDCPQVWALRRYRDYALTRTWYGRIFIHTYYVISPTIVKCFGHTKWFKKIWKCKLDQMVKKLQDQGVEASPYKDRI